DDLRVAMAEVDLTLQAQNGLVCDNPQAGSPGPPSPDAPELASGEDAVAKRPSALDMQVTEKLAAPQSLVGSSELEIRATRLGIRYTPPGVVIEYVTNPEAPIAERNAMAHHIQLNTQVIFRNTTAKELATDLKQNKEHGPYLRHVSETQLANLLRKLRSAIASQDAGTGDPSTAPKVASKPRARSSAGLASSSRRGRSSPPKTLEGGSVNPGGYPNRAPRPRKLGLQE
ncbi:unnamed protein product, partial [Polarella glacialis]